ncbi:DUF692 domain-containing protein [Sphingomonas jaspsi]|uniref:DUF692 domain-containing protein n=1 Tax=Sphingomonas jaspsi TaxID=392409 RepID=UPI0004BB90B3|nr:DUF692 family multinuclear iron-containing protein [Sphingomonas jaspsi]
MGIADPAGDAPRLGVGIMANLAIAPFVCAPGAVDYVAVTPDMFWTDRGRSGGSGAQRFTDVAAWVAMLDDARLPTVSHHIGLSIASAVPTDHGYVAQMAAWAERWDASWISEHLAFVAISDGDGPAAAGLALTAPFDLDVLDLAVERASYVREETGRPFLLENSPYYVAFEDSDLSEADFLNRFCDLSGSGLLLDLHNLYCNTVNHHFCGHRFLDHLDLTRVIEVHIANGSELGGMYADSHSGAPPEPVWALLDDLVSRAPNLRGITFEFHDSYLPLIGFEGIAGVIARARKAWSRRI